MRILDERVENYFHDLRPARSEVMAEMEEVARRDSVPIVHWETGRFLGTLCLGPRAQPGAAGLPALAGIGAPDR